MRFVHFKAPFGAFRPFKNVELATTAEFVTYSAAYGLLLGLAGIERERKAEFIGARIALGCTRLPRVGRTFQLLIQGKRELADTGGEFNLRPFWRELICDLEGWIGLDHPLLEQLVEKGVTEGASLDYWGVTFMGDNSLFVEKIEVEEQPQPCRWFGPFSGQRLPLGERLYYLSVWTDYRKSSDSSSRLFALSPIKQSLDKDDEAWIKIEPNTLGGG